MKAITAALIIFTTAFSFSAHASPRPTVTNAVDGIFAAFQKHPVVGLGEEHNLAQEMDFYVDVIRDPRFASEVGNVVLEIGDAAQQQTIDRYINGETVPYAELRRVWSDTVGWFPTVTALGSINLYATIREVNLKLPPEKRIKVWLGDPPIDWSQVKTKADWEPLEAQRDSFPAALIVREILSNSKKALVIYGNSHFGIFPDHDDIRTLLDRTHPGALYVVTPYIGYATKNCGAAFENTSRELRAPSLLAPVRGSSLEKDLYRPGCGTYVRAPEETEAAYEMGSRNNLGLNGDALLYLGRRDQMLQVMWDPETYLDPDYRAELERRFLLRTGEKLEGMGPLYNPAVPRPMFGN